MPAEHIIKSYDEELNRLSKMIVEMGGLAESQLAAAIDAVIKRDSELAARVVEGDAKVDQLETELDNLAIRLLALRQPMARDLREIFVALKIASDLERICDYAANVAKRSIALSQSPPIQLVHALPRMAQFALLLVKDVIDAYVEHEDPRNIGTCTHLLFMAKNIERIGDHATNIAENLYYLVHGTPLTQARPKGDKSSLEVVAPDRAESR